MSRFQPLESFRLDKADEYKLLPLRFSELDADRFLLSNFVGEFHVLDKVIARDFLEHRLHSSSPHYEDLKSKHFLIDEDSNIAIDLLALKTRTRLERVSNFTALHLFVVTLRCEHSCPY